MRQSVSRVICADPVGDLALDNQRHRVIRITDVRICVGRLPARPYRVIFTLNARGRFLVRYSCVMPVLVNLRAQGSLPVCFLPASWDGLRVSRTVTPMRGKK